MSATRGTRGEELIRRIALAAKPFTPDENIRRDCDRSADGETAEDDCPVVALGQRNGAYFFIAASGEVREIAARDLTANGILALFNGDPEWLEAAFPNYGRDGQKSGFNIRKAAAGLMQRCARAGLWNPDTSVRWVGVWRSVRGLVVHCGDRILIVDHDGPGWASAGRRVDGAIYAAAPKIAPPADTPADRADTERLFTALKAWNFKLRAAPKLVFGWIASAMLGAASPWRCHLLVSGPRGCGKSVLAQLAQQTLGAQARSANNFTEAGLRQVLTGEARALVLDEAEGDSTGNRVEPVIQLLRQMSGGDGAVGLRGSAGGVAQRFSLAGSAFLSAINAPALLPQDRSRITEIELEMPDASKAGEVESIIEQCAALSAAFRARAIAGFDRFLENRRLYRAALVEADCDARQTEQLGTLLAAADMMLQDDPIAPDRLSASVDEIRALIAAMIADDAEDSDAAQCLATLLTRQIDHWRGGAKSTIGHLVSLGRHPDHPDERRALRVYGLRLELQSDIGQHLLVANRHEGLTAIFRDTRWRNGGWRRALLRLKDAHVRDSPANFDGYKSRCVVIPEQWLPEPAQLEPTPEPSDERIPP